jgi:hypothetical protein
MLWKIGALACVVVVLSAGPAAATYNPKPPGVQGPPTAVSGQTITLTGQGCPPGRAVHYYFRGVPRQYTPVPPAGPPSGHHHHHHHHHHGHNHHEGHHHKRAPAKQISVKHSTRQSDPRHDGGPYGQVVLGNEHGTADGNFTLTAALPRNLGGGLYVVVVKCGNVRVTTNITVTPAGTSRVSTASLISWHGPLPPSGSGSSNVMSGYRVAGAGLLAAGGMVVLSRGRRRRHAPSS